MILSDHSIRFRLTRTVRRCVAVCLCGLMSLGASFAQETTAPYYFDGEDVVFVFDIRNYAEALRNQNQQKVDFEDLKIYDVAVSGEFNNWSRKGWKMQRRNDFLFELRKPAQEFNDAYPQEFRYVVNGKYLTEKEGFASDHGAFSDVMLREIYKLDLSVLKITPDGNILFHLNGYPGAREVILAGSFNNWDEHSVKMERSGNGWSLRADLPPGRYEYKFIVDGKWMHDPGSKESVSNEHGTLNSVLYVTRPVQFNLRAYPNAREVILAGSFNDWNERKVSMQKVNGVWTVTLDLPGGKHHYKYIVDGTWITDPGNPIIEDDGFGNLNSVLFVH